MKLIIAKGKNIKGSERKARIPANIVKGMKVEEAIPVLTYMNKRMATEVLKVLKSAVSNAVHNNKLEVSNLVIRSVRTDKSMRLKRVEYKARGSTSIKQKPFCHIVVELEDVTARNEVESKSEKKAVVKEEPKKDTKVAKKSTKAPAKKTKTVKK